MGAAKRSEISYWGMVRRVVGFPVLINWGLFLALFIVQAYIIYAAPETFASNNVDGIALLIYALATGLSSFWVGIRSVWPEKLFRPNETYSDVRLSAFLCGAVFAILVYLPIAALYAVSYLLTGTLELEESSSQAFLRDMLKSGIFAFIAAWLTRHNAQKIAENQKTK